MLHPAHFEQAKVCEVGSLNINGTIREHFANCEYVGVDIGFGPGVDLVAQGQEVSHSTGYFDTMVSAECFEHNPFWVETFANMLRMTRKGGMVAFSCASTGRPEHGTTRSGAMFSPLTVGQGWDYYRNLDDQDFATTFNLAGWFDSCQFFYGPRSFDLYFCGFLKGAPSSIRFEQLRDMLANQIGAVPLAGFSQPS